MYSEGRTLKKEKWKVSTPETTIDCSATAYFFAKQITETLNLPVGLVINSWGGSRIESWMTEETLSSIQGIDIETAKSSKLDVRNRLGCLYDIMLWPVKIIQHVDFFGIKENRTFSIINSMLR